jgi:hypothetical protein
MNPNNQMQPAPNIFAAPQPRQAPHPMTPPPEPHKTPVALIVAVVVFGLLAITFLILTIIFFSQMSDYKNNSDQKAAVAVEDAKKVQAEELAAQFAEKEKEPLRSYTAPGSAASVKLVYPKTWSLYAIEGKEGSSVNTYFNPIVIADTSNKDNVYALRMEVLDKAYASVVKEYESDAKKGEVTITPFKPERVASAQTGVRIEGIVRDDIKGAMVILPVRDKTIKIWTETENYINDFNNFVIKNLEYSP